MTSLHQRLDQENVHERESAVEMLQSRWRSSSRVIADRPPSQPPSCRQMSGRPSSDSVKESHHKDSYTSNSRLQRSNSKWTSGSEVIADSPPLQPLSHRGTAVGRLQQSGSRWSSGSRAAAFETTSSQALAHHRTIVRPSSVSAMKDHDTFETTIRTFRFLNLSRMHLSNTASGTGTCLRCTASPSA
jgi:hypothetical protein